jgi:4-hydroxy-tetrahydrodipicolinate synthase
MSKAKKEIYAAAITPIGADGEPDMKGLVAHCQALIAAGCDGVAPLGTTVEAAALPFSFRQRVPEALAAEQTAASKIQMQRLEQIVTTRDAA